MGGSVRDYLLQRESKDHDIATSANPDVICKIFPHSITVGKQFGVIKVPVEGTSHILEIATFRRDEEYRDHRHPKGVKFGDPEEDALRRDFTVNALFYDPKTSRILDTVDGVTDLRAKVLRIIGDPMARFKEDALRLLRAVRFTTTLGFEMTPETAEAVKAKAKLITAVSAERIRDELNLMWIGPRPAAALELLSKLSLLKYIMPEVEALKTEGDTFKKTLKALEVLTKQCPGRPATLVWGLILHDVGKPSVVKTGDVAINYAAHELEGAKVARSLAARFKMTRSESDRISDLVENHLKFKEAFKMREATLERFVREPYFSELLSLHKADAVASDGNLAFYEFCASRFQEYQNSSAVDSKLITGSDLIQLGLHPGKEFSEILRVVEDLAFEKKLTSKDQALEFVVKNYVK